jgi:tetratricopeptide (TPR) repeat protein
MVLAALASGYLFAATPLEKAMKYWSSGYQKQKSGDLDGAIADYSKAIKSDPTYSEGYSSRAWARLKKEDYDGAIADSTKCIQLSASDTSCYDIRRTAYRAKGDLVSADNDAKIVAAQLEEFRARGDAARSSARHYSDGEPIPGVGTAIGNVYVLPNGGCFGDKGAGIHWTSGAKMFFGDNVFAQNPMVLVRPGSPATQK